MNFSVVSVNGFVLCTIGEKCPIVDLLFSTLEQAFHYAMSFREARKI